MPALQEGLPHALSFYLGVVGRLWGLRMQDLSPSYLSKVATFSARNSAICMHLPTHNTHTSPSCWGVGLFFFFLVLFWGPPPTCIKVITFLEDSASLEQRITFSYVSKWLENMVQTEFNLAGAFAIR